MAKRRLTILRHAEEITGNVALTCGYYGISRRVFYTWHRRYDTHGLCHGRWSAPAARPSLARMLGELSEPTAATTACSHPYRSTVLGRYPDPIGRLELRMRSCGSELMVPRAPSSIANSLHQ